MTNQQHWPKKERQHQSSTKQTRFWIWFRTNARRKRQNRNQKTSKEGIDKLIRCNKIQINDIWIFPNTQKI